MFIRYRKKTNNFIIETEINELDIVRKLPNRKYNISSKVWIAAAVRFNAVLINEWINKGIVNLSDEAKEILDNILNGLDIKQEDFPCDYPFKTIPRDYQKKGLDYTYSLKNCALHMATGSGKSKTVIDKLSCHYLEGKIKNVLIVCPCSVRHVWITQFKTHCPVDYILEIANIKSRKEEDVINIFISNRTDKMKVLVVGVESLQLSNSKPVKLCEKYLDDTNMAIVVDEAHDIKNHAASRSINLFKMSRKASYRITMTGTPVSQSILDLYGMFNFLDPNIIGIGDYWSFRNRYAEMQEKKVRDRTIKIVIGYKKIDELMDIIRPFTYQVTKEEAAKEIPDKVYLSRYITMGKDQKKAYKDLKKDRMTTFPDSTDATVIVNHVLAAYTALQQITGGHVVYNTDKYNNKGVAIREILPLVFPAKNPKVLEIKSIIDGIEDDEQVIIWAKYRHEVFMLEQELMNYKTDNFKQGAISFLDTSPSDKSRIEKDMNNKDIRYFISTPNSGATGLTMNTVAYVFYYSNSQRLLFREQSEDRNHRIGQYRKVTYFDIIAENTVDEKILDSLSSKKDLSEYVKKCLEEKRDYL